MTPSDKITSYNVFLNITKKITIDMLRICYKYKFSICFNEFIHILYNNINISGLLPARYILAVLGSIGMAIIYGLKVNLSVAMVAMLNHTALAIAGANVHGHDQSTNVTLSVPYAEPVCQGSDSSEAMEVRFFFF